MYMVPFKLMSADELARRIRATLAGRRDVRVGLLFGSRATGRARTDSDVDVAIVGPGVDLLALAAELSQVLGLEVDVVALDDAGYPLVQQVLSHGLVVHEASRGDAAAWRSRALAAAETDRPWFERMRRAWLRRIATRGV